MEEHQNKTERPFLGVQFECCSVYTRVYRKPDVMHYDARCPKCGKVARIEVSKEKGVDAKFVSVKF